MNAFMSGFAGELLSTGTMEKEAALPPRASLSPERIRAIKKGLMRGATGTAGMGLLYKLINPEASTGHALATGGTAVGGGALGRYAAGRAGLGSRGKGISSLIGSVAALRALQRHRKAKRAEG